MHALNILNFANLHTFKVSRLRRPECGRQLLQRACNTWRDVSVELQF